VVDGVLDEFEPETFLWIVFNRPDGGARLWYAWTRGGQPLGDRIDQAALAGGYDCADWLHLTSRHCEEHTRGRVTIQAHPLRPLFADVQAGHREPGELRGKLRRMVTIAAERTGQPYQNAGRMPRWLGVGPALLTGKDSAR
jgi:hypothetical protein